MPYIYVDADDILSDIATVELAEHLVERDGWREALSAALKDKYVDIDIEAVVEDARMLVEDFKLGKPVEQRIGQIAGHFGLIV